MSDRFWENDALAPDSDPMPAMAGGDNWWERDALAPPEVAVPGAPPSRFGVNMREGFRGTLMGEAIERGRSGQTLFSQVDAMDRALGEAARGGLTVIPEQTGGQPSPYGGFPVVRLQQMRDRALVEGGQRQDTFQQETLPARRAEEAALPRISGPLEAATALAGQLVGGMGSPESFVGPAGARWARDAGEGALRFAGRQAVESGVPNAAVAAAADVPVQTGQMARGEREAYDPVDTALAALLGGAIGTGLPVGVDQVRGFRAWLAQRRGTPNIDAASVTPAEVAAWRDAEVEAMARANGITDPADPRLTGQHEVRPGWTNPSGRSRSLAERLDERRAAESSAPAAPVPAPPEPVAQGPNGALAEARRLRAEAEREAQIQQRRAEIATPPRDINLEDAPPESPAAQPRSPFARQPAPEVIQLPEGGGVPMRGTADPNVPGLEAGVALRGGDLRSTALVPTEPQPSRMTPSEIVRARAAMDGGNPNTAEPPPRMVAPDGRLPQTPDQVQMQREASGAFEAADAQRQRVGDAVRDTQPAARPEGVNSQTVYLDQGFPVRIIGRDDRGFVSVERYDPRTGQADPEAVPYVVREAQLQARQYATQPRQAQDFTARSGSPSDPEMPREAGPGRPPQEPRQTYRATAPDANRDFPGAGTGRPPPDEAMGRSPFPETPEGPGTGRRWSSAEEAERAFQQRRAQAEAEADRARETGEWNSGQRSTNTPAGQDSDGRWRVDSGGYVASNTGGPVRFGEQRMAARWILNQGQAKSPDQFFEIAVHPSGQGFTVREAGRNAGSAFRPDEAPAPAADAAPVARLSAPQGTSPHEVVAALRRAKVPEAEVRAMTPDQRAARLDEMATGARRAAAFARAAPEAGADTIPPAPSARDVGANPPSSNEKGASAGTDSRRVPAGNAETTPPAQGTDIVGIAGRGSNAEGDAQRAAAFARAAPEAGADTIPPAPSTPRRAADNVGPAPGDSNAKGDAAAQVVATLRRAGVTEADIRAMSPTERRARAQGASGGAQVDSGKGSGAQPVKRDGSALYASALDPAAFRRFLGEPVAAAIRQYVVAPATSAARAVGGSNANQDFQNIRRVFTASTRAGLRALVDRYPNVPQLRELTDHLATDPGRGKLIRETFESAFEARSRSMTNRMRNIAGETIDDEGWQRLRDIMTGARRSGIAQKEADAARRLRGLLDEHFDYLTKAGLDLGYVRGRYFPRAYDTQKILGSREAFMADVQAFYRQRMGLGVDDARDAANDWFSRLAGVGEVGGRYSDTPNSRFTKGRTLPAQADTDLAKWMLTDPREALTRYFIQSSRNAEFVRRFGPAGKKADDTFQAMRDAGAREKDIELAREYFQAATGTLHGTRPSHVASTVSWIQTVGTLRLLPRAVISSAVEAMGIASRTGNPWDAARGLADTWRSIIGSGDIQAARDAAELMGIVGDSAADAMRFSASGGLEPSSRLQQRIVAGMFRNTGLEGLTRHQRVAATRIGQAWLGQLLRDVAEGSKTSRSAEYLLRDLGVDASDAKVLRAWLRRGDGVLKQADLLGDSREAGLYRTAISRFVNEAIQNPQAVDKPAYASAPVGRLAYGITSFMFAFARNMMLRTVHTAAEGVTGSGYTLADRLRLTGPIAGIMLLGVAQFGVSELREMLLNPNPRAARDPFATGLLNLDRAGVWGVLAPLVHMASAAKYDQDPTSLLVGPALSTMSGDIGRMTLAMLPKEWGGPNSPNTDTAERRAARAAWQGVLAPAAVAFISLAPGGNMPRIAYGAGSALLGSPVVTDGVVGR